ncbi:MAG TPA: EamA family transporter, partial [Gemmatimonadales bacterium]|nr:EamA family transporter [Gemmatimonadales bacterium]
MATTTPAQTRDFPASPLSRRRRISTDDLGMLLVCLIWGFNFSITKSAFDQLPPLAFTAIRFAISSVLL